MSNLTACVNKLFNRIIDLKIEIVIKKSAPCRSNPGLFYFPCETQKDMFGTMSKIGDLYCQASEIFKSRFGLYL